MKPPYYLIEDGKTTGPHSLIVLHQKAEIRVIDPESSVRPVTPADAPWLPIRTLPDLHALLFPPKTAPTLATHRSVAVTNPPINTAGGPIEVERLLRGNTARLVATEHFNPSAISNRRHRRHCTYLLTVLAFAAPGWAALRFRLIPHTEMAFVLLVSFVALAALLSYWIIYHVTDFRS